MVRFRPEDITSGASDLEIYPYCRDHGWKLYFRLDLHAKTYVFDHLRCIIGSANATSSGMNIGGTGNYEMAAVCELADKDLRSLDLLLRGSVEMNDDIYNAMETTITAHSQQQKTVLSWPQNLLDMFVPDYSLLFAEDFPTCSHPADATDEDLIFINLSSGMPTEIIKASFVESKCFQWLVSTIKKQEKQEMYFGAISANLHNILLNDPKPFRKDVKQLLSNLLNWIDDLDIDELRVDRPNHSQRVRYINREV